MTDQRVPPLRVVSRRGTPSRALLRDLSLPPHSRCPTSGPPGSATAPPTWSRAAWSSAAWACPTPRSTASSTAPVRPRSAPPFFSIRHSHVITRDARPAPARRRRASRRFPRARIARRSPADATTTRASCARSRPHARCWFECNNGADGSADRPRARVVAESNTAQKTPNARDNRFFAR